MKKYHLLFMLSVLFSLTFTRCSVQESKNKNEVYTIRIESPIVLSHNSVKIADGNMVFINIEMTSGQYLFDELSGASHGNNWNGHYQVRVYTNERCFNNPVYLAPIFIDDSQLMDFKGEFSLAFDDYNNDGNPEFTLGQYVSSNGYEYALFTISETVDIKKLDTDGLMFISKNDYSIELEKVSSTSFRKSCYDNSIGKAVESIYQWKDNKFIPED